MNDADRLTWTKTGNITLHMPTSYDDHEAAKRREALDRDDTAQTLVEALGNVLDGMGRMRHRHGPTNPDLAFQAAQTLIDLATGMQDELMMSTMASHGAVARATGIAKSTAQSQRKALNRGEARRGGAPTVNQQDARYQMGYRPRWESAETWYVDSYADQDDDDEPTETTGNTVVNISHGNVGIQSGGSVDGKNIVM